MKRIILAVAIFLAVFIVSVVIMFPLSKVVEQQLNSVITAKNIPISYASINSSLFSTKIEGIELNDANLGEVVLGNLTLKYSPLSAITRSAKAIIDSPFGTGNARLKKNIVTAELVVDAERISRLLGQDVRAMPEIRLNYDIATRKGNVTVNNGPFEANVANMTIRADSITGEANIEDNNIFITSFTSTGQSPATINGRITLDTNNIARSTLSLSGEAFGSLRFTIRGTFNQPRAELAQ